MVKESRFDRILEKLESRTERVSSKIVKDLKSVKPFDTESMSERERLFNYTQIDPLVKQVFREQAPDQYVLLENEMEKLRRKYAKSGTI